MATSQDFIQYVCDKINFDGKITYKKMFGEYMVYANEKPILLVCDNSVFVKILPETREILGSDAQTGMPYDGAKEHFFIDPDDDEKLNELVCALEKITPLPKKKARK